MPDLRIEHIVGDLGIEDALLVRRRVFIDGLHIPADIEQDGLDACAEHYIGYTPLDEPVTTARLRYLDDGAVKIERVSVLPEQQTQQYGSQLMRHILGEVTANYVPLARLDAQVSVKPFYEKLGFRAIGSVFQEVGIDHVRMIKELRKRRGTFNRM